MTNFKLLLIILATVTFNGIVTYIIVREMVPTQSASAPGATQSSSAPTEGFAKKLACAEESKQFCNGKSDLALDACLQDHLNEVGKDCHDQLFKAKVAMVDCEAEIAKFCSKTPFGGGRIRRCLLEHSSDLSSKCAVLVGAPH